MKAFRLEGSSMKPLFKAGDIALVRPFRPGASSALLSPGDCAVYKYEGRTLLHRVIGTEEKGAWLSDDAGRLKPHLVPWERIEGGVVSRNPLKKGRIGLGYAKLRRFLSRNVH
ncbi:MAG: hypothetical protein A3J79_12505 [Elusimicrobia bacterium RIFOXYB2_FULL_62_6]|nr:MAG: hypothetical protein A3J79_12505 [Elusimicrobia bacterium RIFOXYB2_FULL_62_6]